MKRIRLVVLAAIVLVLLVPVAANAERPGRYQFPSGSKIAVTVGAPDSEGYCWVTLGWPSFPLTDPRYSIDMYMKKGPHLDLQYTPMTAATEFLPPGQWTVVVGAHSGPTDLDPWWIPDQHPMLDSLKASFSVP